MPTGKEKSKKTKETKATKAPEPASTPGNEAPVRTDEKSELADSETTAAGKEPPVAENPLETEKPGPIASDSSSKVEESVAPLPVSEDSSKDTKEPVLESGQEDQSETTPEAEVPTKFTEEAELA